MEFNISRVWPATLEEARDVQLSLRRSVAVVDRRLQPPRALAGVDVAYDPDSDRVAVAVVVLRFDNLEVVEKVSSAGRASFPYEPGFFSFRELPPILDALEKLDQTPDLLICDGHGLAHPRKFGLACHLGVLVDLPTIGVAKNILAGSYDPLGLRRGSRSPIYIDGATVGYALRTQDEVKPVFVSVGHRSTLQSACSDTLHLCQRYRLPESTRLADRHARQALSAD